MDTKLAEVGAYPPTTEPLRHGERRTRATEEVSDEVSFVRRRTDNAFEECFGLLGWIVKPFNCHRINQWYIRPYI